MAQIKALANSVRLAYKSKPAYSQTPTGLKSSSTYNLINYFSSSTNDDNDGEKYKFQAAEFSSSRARDVSGHNIDVQHTEHVEYSQNDSDVKDDSHVNSYDTRGGLNLSSVMQTTVPEPYDIQGKRAPTHLNMPGGQVQQRQKYLSDDLHRTHYQTNTREYHTLAKDSSSETSPAKLTQRMKFKQTVRDYGATVMVFHISIALCSLGGFYLAISSGVDVTHLLMKLPIDSKVIESSLAAGVSTFALAYAVHKIFAPVRMAVTVAAAPFIVRYLRKVGFLKAPKS